MLVPFVEVSAEALVADFRSTLLASTPEEIRYNPWPNFAHTADASFLIAHNGDTIFLQYMINEPQLKATAGFNGDIHRDSCVELFISFDDDVDHYYNLEFNCLGYAKVAYGSSREARKLLPLPLVARISSFAKINSVAIDGRKRFQWELLLLIPKIVFGQAPAASLRGKRASANFHKCGDGLDQPHFLSWNDIVSPEPDFHRPEFFGRLSFA